jgi:hypothetical protein
MSDTPIHTWEKFSTEIGCGWVMRLESATCDAEREAMAMIHRKSRPRFTLSAPDSVPVTSATAYRDR